MSFVQIVGDSRARMIPPEVREHIDEVLVDFLLAAAQEASWAVVRALPPEIVDVDLAVECVASAIVAEGARRAQQLPAVGLGPDVKQILHCIGQAYDRSTRPPSTDGWDAKRDLVALDLHESDDCKLIRPGLVVVHRTAREMTEKLEALGEVDLPLVPALITSALVTYGGDCLARSFVTRSGAERRVELFWRLASKGRLLSSPSCLEARKT
jgi:hypothetical protein